MRFFVENSAVRDGVITLSAEDSAHAARVLRMRTGDLLVVCDENGVEYRCRALQISHASVEAEIVTSAPGETEPDVFVTVFAGVSKGERFDQMIQKCVEVGASHIVPFLSEHCVVRIDAADAEKKRARWARIALEASKQSGRSRAVTVGTAVEFAQAVAQAREADGAFLLYEKENRRALRNALCAVKNATTLAVITGPEGGFSPSEAALALAAGVEPVSVGPRILRCETAPVAALCAIMYETGNFDIGE